MKQFHIQKILQKKFKSLFFFLICFVFISSSVFAEILVSGNKNISTKTIVSLFSKNLSEFNSDDINDYQKKLFNTGFFNSVVINVKEKNIYVNVVENPLVNFFYIEGIEKKSLSDQIYQMVSLKENTIFNSYKVNEDLKKINTFLKGLGYLQNKVNFQLIDIKDNKVNLFYNINLNNKFKINRIFFVGDKHFKSSTLFDVIFSSEDGWWKFFSNSTTPTEQSVNYDISKLKRFYLSKGFYDVQITSSSLSLVNDKQVNLTYSIASGDKYKIKKFNLMDNSKVLIKNDISFIGDIFKDEITNKYYNQENIDNKLKLIREYILSSKYNLIVNYNLKKVDKNYLDINLYIDDNPNRQIINKIIITGNSITDDKVIRNSLSFSEGDILNVPLLKSSITKLEGSGLFKEVNHEISSISMSEADILIKVVEQPTGEISAGAGAGTNGATISGSLKENNFLGQGIQVNSTLSIGTEKILGKINYSNPDYKDSGNALNTSFFIVSNKFENANYENKVIGSTVGTNYEIYDKIFLNPGIGVDLDSVNVEKKSSSIIKKREGDYFTTKAFYNLSKNTKNKAFQTTDGYLVGFGQGLSFLSDIPYINNKIFASYYSEYLDGFVGSFKSKLEAINGIADDDIKFSDRLSISSDNLRGFASRGIGPKLQGDFIGGNYSYYGNISTTIPNGLPDKWNAVTNIFFDTANVWGVDDNSTSDSNKIRSSAGVGLSWVSPLGPISFTYAQPLTKLKSDDVEQFNFKIGSAF